MRHASSKATPAGADRDYRLSKSFPYLARRVGVRIGELFDRVVAPMDMDVPTYRVLAALHEQSEQRLSELGEKTSIPLPTLSRMIGALIQHGLVTRVRPESNGRIVEISLSPQGAKLVEQLIPIAIRFEQAALAHLTSSEVNLVKALLERAHRNLDVLEEEIRSGGEITKAIGSSTRSGSAAGRSRKRK